MIDKKNAQGIWKAIKILKTRDFWVEYISLYVSIVIVTLIVQMAIIKQDLLIILFCLIKSLIMTVPNIIGIILGRHIRIVTNHWFLETIIYTVLSMPYFEIFLIHSVKQDMHLLRDMIEYYAIAYFIMGLFIKRYVDFSKRLINRIFDGELF